MNLLQKLIALPVWALLPFGAMCSWSASNQILESVSIQTDTVRLFREANRTSINVGYKTNALALQQLDHIINSGNVDSIAVCASPSARRQAVEWARYIQAKYPHVDSSRVRVRLSALPQSEEGEATCVAYTWAGVSRQAPPKPEPRFIAPVALVPPMEGGHTDTPNRPSAPASAPAGAPEPASWELPKQQPFQGTAFTTAPTVKPLRPLFTVKTNLLFAAVGAVNAGVEVQVAPRWTVGGDFAYAYWHIGNRYALQTIQGSVECAYWFSPSLKGWFAGAYGTLCSRYDVQVHDGYQGDGFWSAGVSGGYRLEVAPQLTLTFSLAAGYFFTPQVRHYTLSDGYLIWRETRYNVGRISLTQVGVTLGYLIRYRK